MIEPMQKKKYVNIDIRNRKICIYRETATGKTDSGLVWANKLNSNVEYVVCVRHISGMNAQQVHCNIHSSWESCFQFCYCWCRCWLFWLAASTAQSTTQTRQKNANKLMFLFNYKKMLIEIVSLQCAFAQ